MFRSAIPRKGENPERMVASQCVVKVPSLFFTLVVIGFVHKHQVSGQNGGVTPLALKDCNSSRPWPLCTAAAFSGQGSQGHERFEPWYRVPKYFEYYTVLFGLQHVSYM